MEYSGYPPVIEYSGYLPELPIENKSNMKILKTDSILYVDIDDTLIMHRAKPNDNTIELTYGTTVKYVELNQDHIDLVKYCKTARNYHIIVHSANGWQWAEYVIKKLKLENFVDQVQTKPKEYLDDRPVEEWFKNRIYIKGVIEP
jgi:hypothetical protein